MAWLQPWAWLGLGALVVPVLVHLLSRRPARTEPFPSLRFLAATPLRPTRRTRLSDWPLLLVRLLILLAAVMALAQPVRRAALAPAVGAVSRVRLVDTLTAALPPGLDSIETVATASLSEGLRRALARLGAMPAPRTLEVISTFADGIADSAMFAALPRDVQLVLTPASARPIGGAAAAPRATAPERRDTLTWRTTLPSAERDAVMRAVSALGGAVPVVQAVAGEATSPLQEIIIPEIMISGGGSVARAADAEALRRVAEDPVLQALLPAGASPRIRITRTGDTLRLAVESARADVALALVMAAGGAPIPRVRVSGPREVATLRRWATLPSGAPIGAGTIVADVHRVETDARWVWLGVLLLLGVEWVMRRAPRERAEASA